MRNNVEGALADYRTAVKLNRKDKTTRDNRTSIDTALRKIELTILERLPEKKQ
jgi:hypothetical protein